MNKTDYTETVKLIQKMVGTSAFVYGVVTAFRGENRTIKAEIQPSGIETGWCRCLGFIRLRCWRMSRRNWRR